MMNRNKTYGPILNDKFSELSLPDMNTTWPEMKDILDKEMPQEKKRRGLVWFSNRFGVLLLILSISTIASLLYFYTNHAQNNLLKKLEKRMDKATRTGAMPRIGECYCLNVTFAYI